MASEYSHQHSGAEARRAYAPLLTKSKYAVGLSCLRCLWKMIHAKHEMPEETEEDRHMFEQGTMIGEFAQKRFPSGIDANDENFGVALEKANEGLKSRKTMFEAGFKAGQLYARADILEPAGKAAWDLTEVKSSTSVKPEHIEDVAFQKYCYEKAGLKIRKCNLMHINNEFVKKGPINIKEFFVSEDITEDVEAKLPEVPGNVKKMLDVINSKTCPKNLKDNITCGDPWNCPIADDCWSFMPEESVLELYSGHKKALELIEFGVLAMKDIPDDYELNDKQMIQHGCAKTKKVHIHKDGIKHFLEQLKYPMRYLDFETYGTAIPLYDWLKPYQNIPFQFSLHFVEKEGAKPKHYSFIAKGSDDPRKKFAEELKAHLGDKGTIVIYNRGFEERILNELAEFLPQYRKWIASLTERMVDLLQPFRDFYYYNPKQGGSASMKVVLPAITGKSYEALEIGEGMSASLAYLYITHGAADGKKVTPEEIKKTRANLERYCGLDTEGMIWIIDELKKLSK